MFTATIREIDYTNPVTYTWTGHNMANNLGCGPNPAQGSCRAWFGMTAATGGRWARTLLKRFDYVNTMPTPS